MFSVLFTKDARSKQRWLLVFCIVILAIGTLLRASYVAAAPYNISQHDLGSFSGLESDVTMGGHLGYIEYFYKFRALPNFDPTAFSCFSNPPLYHIISAVFLDLFVSAGQEYEAVWESLQYLPCLFIFLAALGVFLCLREFDIEGLPLLLGTAVAAFHPTFNYLSVTMNNDALSVAFAVFSVYFAVRWFKRPTFPAIIATAFCIGLGMMTKLHVALVAPPIAFLFLYRFFKDKQWSRMIPQFVLFAMICCPLALYWPLRNYILFDVPIGYVQRPHALAVPPSECELYIGNIEIMQRMGIPAFDNLFRLKSYFYVNNVIGTPDYNLWSQLLRTALFDDNMIAFNQEKLPAILGYAQQIITVILAVLTVILASVGLMRSKSSMPALRIFTASAICVSFAFFIHFCLSYPYSCTIHFRYIVYSLPFYLIGVGLWWQRRTKNSFSILIEGLYAALTFSFCLFSVIHYASL